MAEFLIRFEGLSVARGDRVLLSGLSGQLARGEVVHLQGENGVGKTSLLEVLAGLRDAESGTLERHYEAEACHWVGHRNALHPALSPVENLEFWCSLNETDPAPVRRVIADFGLERVADQACRELSAGQLRRAALSRLALARRDIWFLDEPMSALDRSGLQHWIALLAAHQQRGGAALITSHQALPASLAGVRAWSLP